jgi:hypothetical protein
MNDGQKGRESMKQKSLSYLIQYCIEREAKENVEKIPAGIRLRGIYALFKKKGPDFNVAYIGISTSNMRGRLMSHRRSEKKEWTHFSIYKVWPNITDEEIKELEGLFLHIYCNDSRAQAFNKLKSKKPLRRVRIKNLEKQGEALKNLEQAIRHFPDLKKMKSVFKA